MSILKSKTTLVLAIALLLAGANLVFGATMAQQSVPPAPTASDPISMLTTGASQVKGQTDNTIALNQAAARQNPKDNNAYSRLGLAYLVKTRETNDPAYYSQAEAALKKALEIKPDDYNALAGTGSLDLSRHRFSDALEWGKKAQAVRPMNPFAYGVMSDAYNELGQYDKAIEALQQMVNLRPDQTSYSRISYVRELHGDAQGAIEMMRQAVSSGGPASESTAWCNVQLGNLYFNSNNMAEAERAYTQALTGYPNYVHGMAALAQLRWAQGMTGEALSLYKRAVNVIPLPLYVSALGDLYADMGDMVNARKQYELTMFVFKIQENGGVDVGIEKSLFLSDHDINIPESLALAEKAVKTRQSLYTYDSYAWALYKSGRYQEALAAQKQATRLGMQNPLFYYHLGMIYDKLGDPQNARLNVQKALDMNPYFSILYSKAAQAFVKK